MSKYIKLFEDIQDANSQGSSGLCSPHVSYIRDTGTINLETIRSGFFTAHFSNSGKIDNIVPVYTSQPDDEIWYTTESENIVDIATRNEILLQFAGYAYDGPEILSNTYENGRGVVKFSAPLTKIGVWMDGEDIKQCCILFNLSEMLVGVSGLSHDLSSISFPNSLLSIESIGNEILAQFSLCTKLRSVSLGNSITAIPDTIFKYCVNLTDITIPNTVETIGPYAFMSCVNLSGITIPSSVNTIGEWAFAGCRGLTGITIPSSVNTIGEWAFGESIMIKSNFINNTALNAEENEYWGIIFCDYDNNGFLINDTSLIYYRGTASAVTIPDEVTIIKESAFLNAAADISVYTGDKPEGGPSYITIPSSVSTIESCAFAGCTSLKDITIPGTVTSLGEYTFNSCASLTGATISAPLSCITWAMFSNCTSLTDFTITDNIKFIEQNAFCKCTSLTGITIPTSITGINWYVFKDCTSLTSITLHESINYIGQEAFRGCTSLSEVICNATTPPTLYDIYVFGDNAPGRKFKVPSSAVDTYKAATNWSNYANDIISQ